MEYVPSSMLRPLPCQPGLCLSTKPRSATQQLAGTGFGRQRLLASAVVGFACMVKQHRQAQRATKKDDMEVCRRLRALLKEASKEAGDDSAGSMKDVVRQACGAAKRNAAWKESLNILQTARDFRARGFDVDVDVDMLNDLLQACAANSQSLAAQEALVAIFRSSTKVSTAMCGTVISSMMDTTLKLDKQRNLTGRTADKRVVKDALEAMWSNLKNKIVEAQQTLIGKMQFAKALQTEYEEAVAVTGKAGRWQLAVQAFCDMELWELKQDGSALTAAITACGESSSWRAALALLGDSKDVDHIAKTIWAVQEAGKWNLAGVLLNKETKEALAKMTFATTVQFVQADRWQAALERLRTQHVDDSQVADTWSAIFNGRVDESYSVWRDEKTDENAKATLEIFDEMKEKELKPDLKTFHIAMFFQMVLGDKKSAAQTYKECGDADLCRHWRLSNHQIQVSHLPLEIAELAVQMMVRDAFDRYQISERTTGKVRIAKLIILTAEDGGKSDDGLQLGLQSLLKREFNLTATLDASSVTVQPKQLRNIYLVLTGREKKKKVKKRQQLRKEELAYSA